MATEPKAIPISAGDVPITGKETEVNGSASGSDIDIHKTSKGRDGTTFVAQGLRQDNYRPVDTYEGIHRFDPEFEWEPEEERKIVRKVSVTCQATQQYADMSRLTSASVPGSV